jgi:hypothetical protein
VCPSQCRHGGGIRGAGAECPWYFTVHLIIRPVDAEYNHELGTSVAGGSAAAKPAGTNPSAAGSAVHPAGVPGAAVLPTPVGPGQCAPLHALHPPTGAGGALALPCIPTPASGDPVFPPGIHPHQPGAAALCAPMAAAITPPLTLGPGAIHGRVAVNLLSAGRPASRTTLPFTGLQGADFRPRFED